VVVRYEQDIVESGSASEPTWRFVLMERRWKDYTVPNTLNLKRRSPGVKYEPYDIREAAEKLKNNKYAEPREEQKS
jgi:hypothetical protein